jgi:hypothetical protein
MANNQRPSVLRTWIHFFLGHPVRLFWTCVGLFVLLTFIRPDIAGVLGLRLAVNVWAVVQGILPTIILVGCIVWGIYLIARPLRPKKKKKGL